MKNLTTVLLFLFSLILFTSCGKDDNKSHSPSPVVTTPAPSPTQPEDDIDVEDPVEEEEADEVVGILGTYIEQGSTTDSTFRIKCAPNSVIQSEQAIVFKIMTSDNGNNLKVYREFNETITEEFVDLKDNTVYYLYTDYTSTETFGIQSTSESSLTTCSL